MPTILIAGKEEKRNIPIWAQQPLKCKTCGCEFQMDIEETSLIYEERAVAGGPVQFWHTYCPHCSQRVTVANPDFTPPDMTDAERLAEAAKVISNLSKQLNDAQAELVHLKENSIPLEEVR